VGASDGQPLKPDVLAELRSRLGQTFCRFVAMHACDDHIRHE
jgi:hypothetical protein